MQHRSIALTAALLATWTILTTTSAVAEDSPQVSKQTTSQIEEITPQLRSGVHRGLSWLAKQQSKDGSFGSDSPYGPHVGITGIVGLAFLSDGQTPGRGRYGAVVSGCVDFILKHRSDSGLLAAGTSHGPMYGHAFATLFLAEVYGMSPNPEVRNALSKAINLIVTTQNDEGGWRYQPVRADADISVTVCQIMALRAASNAGIHVDKSVIDRGVSYIRNCQNPDGGFRYMISPGASAFPRSAGAVAALQYAGLYKDESVVRGLEYLREFVSPANQPPAHYHYGQYYAVQAMFLAGDEKWTEWFPKARDSLLAQQEREGNWRSQSGQQYGTAMALIVLQVPNRLLPVLQK